MDMNLKYSLELIYYKIELYFNIFYTSKKQ
jgi:hypothetical protein